MNKKLIVVSLMVIALIASATTSFGATAESTWSSGNLSFGATTPLSIATSKNVNLYLDFSGTANPVINYVMGAFHGSGTRSFATSNQDAKIFYFDETGKDPPSVSTVAGTPPTWGTGWSPL